MTNTYFAAPEHVDTAIIKIGMKHYQRTLDDGELSLEGDNEKVVAFKKAVVLSSVWLMVKLHELGCEPEMTSALSSVLSDHAVSQLDPWGAAEGLLQEYTNEEHKDKYDFKAIGESLKQINKAIKEEK